MGSRAAARDRGFSRTSRLVALATVVAICGSVLLLVEKATAELLCETPGSTQPIGPHDSTPAEYRGSESGAPLSVGGLWDWSGPCGTTNRTEGSEKNWDYYYLDIEEELDLGIRLLPDDPADRFDVALFRGWVATGDRAFRPNCSVNPEPPCALAAGSNLIPSETGEIALDVPEISPVIHTLRVNYAAVVEGFYRGRVMASSSYQPDPGTEDPSQDPEPPDPYVRGDYTDHPNDPLFGDQWGISTIRAPAAWTQPQATGFGITIAVVDTGIDLSHPDLSCPGKLVVLEGANQVEKGVPQDDDGHGTHVAGIAAACSNNETGVVGVAPDAAIMPVRVDLDNFENNAPGGGSLDHIMAKGIRFATEHGAHVINLSIGPYVAPDIWWPELHDETEKALEDARAAGVVVVASAGNFYLSPPSPFCGYPALSRSVICVGATDRRDNVAWYSYLPNKFDSSSGDLESEMTVVAPGGAGVPCTRDVREGIVSTELMTEPGTCNGYENGYQEKDGTSMASPHVAGVAALVYDRLGGERNSENAEAVINAIISTAKDLYAEGPDPISGYGRVNAHRAVSKIVVPTAKASALSLSVDGPGSSRSNLVATLTDAGSGVGLSEETIEFFADGAPLGPATTDEHGVAVFALEGRFRGAGHYFEAVFSGTQDYEGSSASAQT